MDAINTTAPEVTEQEENLDSQVKAYLQTVLPQEVYDEWIEDFVFESADENEITVGYYGDKSLSIFRKEYKEMVWLHVCSVVGYVKSMKIHKRHGKGSARISEKGKKHIKVAKLFVISLLFALVTILICVLAGNYIKNRNFRESFYNTSSIKADSKVRIIQISDLHNSVYGKENKKLKERVAKLNPDIIVLTGDIVDSSSDKTERTVDLCKALAETAPTYYIYGNNEVEMYYDTPLTQEDLDAKYGFNDKNRNPAKVTEPKDALEKALEAVGVKVLKNEKDSLVLGETEVDVYGVLTSNPSAFWSYAGESFEQYLYENPNNLKITAIHEPFAMQEFSTESWGDIVICGHTHGGSVKVPLLGPLYTHEGGLFPERNGELVYGRYDASGTPLIVSSGMDNKTIFRINNQPELVIIDVNRF